MLMRGPIKQEGIKITNIYAANIRTADICSKVLLDLHIETGANTIVLSDLNTPLSSKDRATGQKANNDVTEMKQCGVSGPNRHLATISINNIQTAFFSSAYWTLPMTTYKATSQVSANLKF